MKSITTAPALKGKRVLVRVDYNVPLKGNRILDTRRIESSYKTIDFILKKKAIPILVAHHGEGEQTLKPIATFLSKRYKVVFLQGPLEGSAREWIVTHLAPGTVFLLENIRRNGGEEKNSTSFAKALASLADVYVNDAFSVSHRTHASILGVRKYLPSFSGFQFQAEIKALSVAQKNKKHPFLFILGGAKFGTKIPLIDRFSVSADGVVITGAILNTFLKVAGFEVGVSVVEDGYEIQVKKILKHPSLLLPTDVTVLRNGKSVVCSVNEVQPKDKIVDIGPRSTAQIVEKITKAKLVVWNGPTGWYEGGFTKGTVVLAKAIMRSNTTAIIGGGDTAGVLEKMLKKTPPPKNIFISTGGGATLEYLAKGTLPGVQLD